MMQSLFQDDIDYAEHVAARIELLQELLELYSDPKFKADRIFQPPPPLLCLFFFFLGGSSFPDFTKTT